MGARYSIYEAKAKLSEIVRMVKRNRRVVITERGRPVAQVLPYEEPRTLDDRIADLTGRGAIQPATEDHRTGLQPIARRPGALQRILEARKLRDESVRRHLRPSGRRPG